MPLLLLVVTFCTTVVVGARMEFNFLNIVTPFVHRRRNAAAVSRAVGAGRTLAPAAGHALFAPL